MDIFSRVEALDLPQNEFVVLGSGILAALGIREVGDIDLLVKPEFFEVLKNNGWSYEVIEIGGQPREMISKGNVQAFKDFWFDEKIFPVEEGFKRSVTIKGVKFISLQTLLEYKKTATREKDANDVLLIEEYLKNNS